MSRRTDRCLAKSWEVPTGCAMAEALVPVALGAEQPDSLASCPKRRQKPAKKKTRTGQPDDALVSAPGRDKNAPRAPVQRSKFATAATPASGEQRRKELGKMYEKRRTLKLAALSKARAAASASGGLPPRPPLKDMLGKKFQTVGEILRDAQQLVMDEHVRLEHAGRREVVDFEERKIVHSNFWRRTTLLCER